MRPQLFLGLRRHDEDETARRGIGARRPHFRKLGDLAQGRFGDGALLPPAMGAGFTKEPVQSDIGQGVQQANSKEKARLERAALR
jgi:hypothetical protein